MPEKVNHKLLQEVLAVMSLSLSHFHSPVSVHRPNLSLVASEDPQAGAAALHAPDPDGPFIKYVRAIPRNLLS